MSPHRIVVLTPVRNEAWILRRFLETTTRWADSVLVADQGSTDGSREICQAFGPKVELLDNDPAVFNEAKRQRLLISAARERRKGSTLLLALDADEIVAADAPGSEGWMKMLEAPPGTVVCLEKPDLWNGMDHCLRYATPWPLGYVDDGALHEATAIHSIRIPTPQGAPRLELADVKVMHLAFVRSGIQNAKARFYSVHENLLGASRLYSRRTRYSSDRDWSTDGVLGPVPRSWIDGWEVLGIDLRDFRSETYYWQDFEVLRLMALHGERRFWMEHIWDFDWESCRQAALDRGVAGMPESPIVGPPATIRTAGRALDRLYASWIAWRRKANAGPSAVR